jgi:uncharacterized membrane protein YkvA (DUF1232 family)
VAKAIETFRAWAETVRTDVDAFKQLLESNKADDASRQLAAAALGYFVSKMDLIPDWNEGIGVIDDVMVLRVCGHLTQGHPHGELPAAAEASLGRLANEAEAISAFLGSAIYDKFKQYCAKLTEQSVRGRSTMALIGDANLRTALYAEVAEELQKNVPIVIADPEDAELRLKSYLTQKLR